MRFRDWLKCHPSRVSIDEMTSESAAIAEMAMVPRQMLNRWGKSAPTDCVSAAYCRAAVRSTIRSLQTLGV